MQAGVSDFCGGHPCSLPHSSSAGLAPVRSPRLHRQLLSISEAKTRGHPVLTTARTGDPSPEELVSLSAEELKRSLLIPAKPTADQRLKGKRKESPAFCGHFVPCGSLLVIQMWAKICEDK